MEPVGINKQTTRPAKGLVSSLDIITAGNDFRGGARQKRVSCMCVYGLSVFEDLLDVDGTKGHAKISQLLLSYNIYYRYR